MTKQNEPLIRIAKRTSLCRIHSFHRGITNVHVEIAKTPSAIMQGLMHRTYLPYDSGMVFLFPRPTSDGFWMRNTYIPLSIAFWDSNDTIIAIMDMEPCEGVECPTYTPGTEYVGALEVNRGFFDDHGVEVGDKVEVIPMGGIKTADISHQELDIPISDAAHSAIQSLHDKGHTSLVVGGAVRDALLGEKKPKDVDVEVYGMNMDDLHQHLSQYGNVNAVGKAFGVLKFTDHEGNEYDFSSPRRDNKTGVGHKDFNVEVDHTMTPKEAASRRDFTINSMAYNPLTKELHDDYGGKEDLENRVLRHTSEQFSEDPLRVLRGMQFASRFGMSIHPETAKMCQDISDQYDTLPKERVSEEFMKMATKGKEPGRALDYLEDTGWMKHLPHMAKLRGTAQEGEWHPEGDVHEHTKHAMNAAARICDEEGITGDDRATAVLGAMVHDIGKPVSSQIMNKGGQDRITSHGHEQAGGPLARETLESIGIKPDIVNKVQPIVENHLAHINFEKRDPSPRAIRRLAQRLHPASIQEASIVMRADHAGRPPLSGDTPPGVTRMLAAAEKNQVKEHQMDPIIQGRHVMPYFNDKPGRHIGEVTRAAYEAQLNGEFSTEEEGTRWLSGYMKTRTSSWKKVTIL